MAHALQCDPSQYSKELSNVKRNAVSVSETVLGKAHSKTFRVFKAMLTRLRWTPVLPRVEKLTEVGYRFVAGLENEVLALKDADNESVKNALLLLADFSETINEFRDVHRQMREALTFSRLVRESEEIPNFAKQVFEIGKRHDRAIELLQVAVIPFLDRRIERIEIHDEDLQLALAKEFAEQDRRLAESGIKEYAASLNMPDEKTR